MSRLSPYTPAVLSKDRGPVPLASSPFAAAATPTPAQGSRHSNANKGTGSQKNAKKGGSAVSNPSVVAKIAPAARKTNNPTAYDKSVAAATTSDATRANPTNNPPSSTGSNPPPRGKGKGKDARQKEERLAKKQKYSDRKLGLEKERVRRESEKHRLEMEAQKQALAEIERERHASHIRTFFLGLDEYDFDLELAGQVAFGPRWPQVRPNMEKIAATRAQARRKADQVAVDDGARSLSKKKEKSAAEAEEME